MNNEGSPSGQSQESIDSNASTERGFICRAFYSRGGKTIPQLFAEAKTAGVDESWFSDAQARVVWKAAEELFKGEDFSAVNLFRLTKTANRIAKTSRDEDERAVTVTKDFFDRSDELVRGTDDFSSYIRLLKDASVARKMRQAMADASEAFAAGDDAQSVVSRLIVSAQGVLRNSAPKNKVSISSLVDEIISDYRESYHQIVELGNVEYTPGLPIPWRKLAYVLNGMTAGVYVLAARPGVGKTALALNFARFWCDKGLKVVFNSIDMDPKSYIKRALSERSRISQRKMQFAKSTNFEADIAKIEREAAELKSMEQTGNFSLYTEHDIETFKACCSILHDQGKADVIVIDYLQLLRFKGCMRLGRTQQVTFCSNLVHEMSVELGIPVLCLSQLNRDTTKDGGREPELADLRESGAIEQDATAVMLLYRDERLRKKWRESEPPVQYARNMTPSPALDSISPVWMKVAKSREGDEGVRIPFVAMQSKCAWYQGDYQAKGDEKFARIYDDWRHDPIEDVWERNGALIRMADVRAVEKKNRELREQEFSADQPPKYQEPQEGGWS